MGILHSLQVGCITNFVYWKMPIKILILLYHQSHKILFILFSPFLFWFLGTVGGNLWILSLIRMYLLINIIFSLFKSVFFVKYVFVNFSWLCYSLCSSAFNQRHL